MQGTGWLPITSLDIHPPLWLGLWFGVFPTVETLLAQAVAAAFVIGSYYVAQEVRVKRPQRSARKAAAAPPAPAPAAEAATEADPARL
jgi:high-affinity iron transporter